MLTGMRQVWQRIWDKLTDRRAISWRKVVEEVSEELLTL